MPGSDVPFESARVRVRSAPITLAGILDVPEDPCALVVFVHGSGSNHNSPRDATIAGALGERRIATLRFDLLSAHEENVDYSSPQFRFDHALLAGRVVDALDWVSRADGAEALPIGLIGSSTGAAAACIAAVRRPRLVRALVARGGRIDLAEQILGQIHAPTLLVVGDQDEVVLAHNRRGLEQIGADTKGLELVPGTGHLFEEPEAIETAAALAGDWFALHLGN